MKTRFKLNPMDSEWLARCKSNGWTRDSIHSQYDDLKNRLLDVAGQAVCLHKEPDILDIMRRGKFFRGYNATMMKGAPCKCHSNSAALWNQNRNVTHIATGYALTRDGMWRQHSWCMYGAGVVETTVKRLLYYGFVMTYDECVTFWMQNDF